MASRFSTDYINPNKYSLKYLLGDVLNVLPKPCRMVTTYNL